METGSGGAIGGDCGALAAAFEKTVEAGAADAEHVGGFHAIAAAGFEHAHDVRAADFVKWDRAPFGVGQRHTMARLLDVLRQVANVDEIRAVRDRGAGNDVFEFADISRPFVMDQSDLSATSESAEEFVVGFGVFLQEVLHENRNVFIALAQSGNANFDAAEPVEKIFAETACQNFGAQVAIYRCDHAYIHFFHFGRTDALNLAILDHAEKLRLHGE